jgi:hypothetical protein
MTDLSLAEKLLARIGEISRRSDVIVRNQSNVWGGPIGRWKDTLPADMLAFFTRLNGLVFHYAFKDQPDHQHGFALLALDSDGKKVIDPIARAYRIPRQAAKRYPAHFFQPGEVQPETDVLFFFGSDDAWGVIMVGAGQDATFRSWDNDGFTKPMPATFTQLIERLMDNGFAHTWSYESHPDTDAVRERLARKVPERHSLDVVVHSRTELSAAGHREKFLARFDDDAIAKMARALGKPPKSADRAALLAVIHTACGDADSVTDKAAVAAMRATGHKKPTRELFIERFVPGDEALVELDLTLRYVKSEIPFALDRVTLVRALDSLPGSRFAEDFPGPRELLQCTYPPKDGIFFHPWLACETDEVDDPSPTEQRYKRLVARSWRATGLEAGKTYACTALPAVEQGINARR